MLLLGDMFRSQNQVGIHQSRIYPRAANSLVGLVGLAALLTQACQAEEAYHRSGCIHSEDTSSNKSAVEESLLTRVHFAGEDSEGHPVVDRMQSLKVPGLSFALINRGKIEWAEAYGVKIAGENEPVTCNTLFQAASLSKPVTMLAVMRFAEAGLINLDTDIQTYLKDYQLPKGGHSIDNPVTFRNILSHTSGLSAGGYMGYEQNGGFPTDLEVLMGTGVTNSAKLEAPQAPGTELAYSGGGYTVAEVAMQDVTGDSFKALMDEWLLQPAGMINSDFSQPLPTSQQNNVAHGHDASGEPVKGGWHNHPEQAAAGLWSTAGDLATLMVEIFDAYHGESDILQQETVRQIIADRRDGHAYGFLVESRDDGTLSIRHYGGNVGYRSFMMIDLETGDGAVYLTNSDDGGDLGHEFLYAASKVYGWPNYRQIEATRMPKSAKELQGFVGSYAFDEDLRVDIDYSEAENAIGIIFPNGERYSLVPIVGEEQFIHPGSGVTVSFGEERSDQTLTVYGDTGTKIE